MHRSLVATLLAIGLVATIAWAAEPAHTGPAAITFTAVNVEYEGSKIWVPSTFTVKRGTKVTLKLINNVPSEPQEHGRDERFDHQDRCKGADNGRPLRHQGT